MYIMCELTHTKIVTCIAIETCSISILRNHFCYPIIKIIIVLIKDNMFNEKGGQSEGGVEELVIIKERRWKERHEKSWRR